MHPVSGKPGALQPFDDLRAGIRSILACGVYRARPVVMFSDGQNKTKYVLMPFPLLQALPSGNFFLPERIDLQALLLNMAMPRAVDDTLTRAARTIQLMILEGPPLINHRNTCQPDVLRLHAAPTVTRRLCT